MVRCWLIVMVLGAGIGLACGEDAFHCTVDAQCMLAGIQGVCQPNAFCTFPDGDCMSGQRYGEGAGDGLAGTCLDGGGSSGPGSTSEVGTQSGDGMPGTSTGEITADDTSSSGGQEETSGSDDGPPGDDPYGSCSDSEECLDPKGDCLDFDTEDVCAPSCEVDADCPLAMDATAGPVCAALDKAGPRVCVLLCEGFDDCPEGMDCSFRAFGGKLPICVWD